MSAKPKAQDCKSFIYWCDSTRNLHIFRVGRYQVSTYLKRDWVYVYVIDTTTGVVKFVEEKNEHKPLEEIMK